LSRPTAAIVGSGNIGTDLMFKLLRSDIIDLKWMVGIDPASEGLAKASGLGLSTSADGVDWLLTQDVLPDLVFEATSAPVHAGHAHRYKKAGICAIDLTPAALGPYVIPTVNLEQHLDAVNVNLVTCGGQATIPIVHAVSRVITVPYAEIVSTVASKSAGPGTRKNIDEFTRTTARAVEVLGGATRGKAIIILNPAEPPLVMQDTIFCAVQAGSDRTAIEASIEAMVREVQQYVPGYRLRQWPQFDEVSLNGRDDDCWDRVSVFIEVEGAGDYLPPYSGNLDIMTAAARRTGEMIAKRLVQRNDAQLGDATSNSNGE